MRVLTTSGGTIARSNIVGPMNDIKPGTINRETVLYQGKDYELCSGRSGVGETPETGHSALKPSKWVYFPLAHFSGLIARYKEDVAGPRRK